MFGRKLAIASILWLITATSALAQISIQAQVVQRELRAFFLSDFNFTGRGRSSTEIFSLTIMNTTGVPETNRLGLSISSNNLGGLASGVTRPFTIAPGQVIRITNTNLFSLSEMFSLDEYHIEDNGKELRDRVLSLGKLPSDIYRFTFTILPVTGEIVLSDTYIEIDVSNPTSLDLIGPGSPSDRGMPGVSPTLFPLFRWTSNLSQFRLTLAERLPDVHEDASPAEIIQDRIRFERTFTVNPGRVGSLAADGSEYIASNSYLYPAAGAWPLEQGKSYFWQITGLLPSSGGITELPSEIWSFTVREGSGWTATSGPSLEELLGLLRPELGDDFFARFGSGGDLEGFTLSGRYYLNGRWISQEQLQAILAKLASGDYKLIETRVE